MKEDSAAVQVSQFPNPSTGSGPARILITEDELIVALDLQVRLKDLGYVIVGIASSGDDAILQVQEQHPDLVLMDIMLTNSMDGIEAAQHIHAEHDIPVIFITANGDRKTLERAGATHPFSCLLKPFKERELKFSIEMALHHHRASRELRIARDELEKRVEARTAELTTSNNALQNELRMHRQTLAELRSAQTIAKCADRVKTEFLSSITHELLTPMNGILGMVEVMLDSSPNAQQHEQLGIIQDSAETLLSIINDLLDFSRIEQGTVEFSHDSFSVREHIGAYLRPLISRASDKSLHFAWHVDDNVPDMIVADQTRIGQILVHLVSNAIKFTERGEVEVKVAQIGEENGRLHLEYSVRDTGIGIPLDKQQAVFEPFVQADSSPSRRYSGAGLGLSISTRLATMMGGHIELDSKPGTGSTFRFNLWTSRAG